MVLRLALRPADHLASSGGEIGRRARLRIWFRKECGFESHPEHYPPSTLREFDGLSLLGQVKKLFETNETFFFADR